MIPDRFGLPTPNEILYGKQPRKNRMTKKSTKSTKKEYKLTLPTRRIICNEVGKCENCGERKDLEVHHIKKVSDGGGHTLGNLIVLCHNCHKNKAHRGSLSATEQKKKLKNRSKKLQEGIRVILNKAKKRQDDKKTTKKKTAKKSTKRRTRQSNPFDIPLYNPPKFKL